MTTKLTLSLSAGVIIKAKETARRRKTSVSKLVEAYLKKISTADTGSITEKIIEQAPAQKTKPGTKTAILKKKLKAKYEH